MASNHAKYLIVLQQENTFLTVEPQYFYWLPRKKQPAYRWVSTASVPMQAWMTYYEGFVDPADPSRCIIPYDCEAGRYFVAAHVTDDGSMIFEEPR